MFRFLCNFFQRLWYFILGRIFRIKGYRPLKEEDIRSKEFRGAHPGPTYRNWQTKAEKKEKNREKHRDDGKYTYVEVERIEQPAIEQEPEPIKVVGFAKVIGQWTKYVIEEKMASMGIIAGEELPIDNEIPGKPKGYWSTLVWLSQSRENQKKWQEIVDTSRHNTQQQRGGKDR